MLKGIASRWLAALTTLLSGFVLMPFLVRHLGQEGYGTWALIASMTSVVGLLMLGAPQAYVRELSRAAGTDDTEEFNTIVGSSLGLYLLMAMIALLVGAALLLVFVRFRIPALLRPAAYYAYALALAGCALGFLSRLPMGILSAHGDFTTQGRISVATDVLRVAGTMLFVQRGWSLAGIALAQLVAVAFEQVLFALAIRGRYQRLRVSLSDFRPDRVRRMLTFSLPLILVGVGGYLSFQTDPLVIGAVLVVGQIPFYLVSSRLIAVLPSLAMAMAAVVVPTATRLHARQGAGALSVFLLTWGRFSFSLVGIALVSLVFVGPRFVAWWIGPGYSAPSSLVLSVLAPGYLFLVSAQAVAYPVLVATGRVGVASAGFLAAGVCNVALSLVLGRRFGLAGVAVGTAIPSALYGVLLHGLACTHAGLRHREYFISAMVVPALRVVLPAALIWYAASRFLEPWWLAFAVGCLGAILLALAAADMVGIRGELAGNTTGIDQPDAAALHS